MNNDRLLNVNQVCNRLALARSTVYGFINEGRLKSVRLGARLGVRVRESEVDRLLKECEDRDA